MIREFKTEISGSSFNLCISNNSQFTKILPEFDKIIQEMQQDGSLEAIYNKYR